MSKVYRATITLTIEPDEQGYLDWQDSEDSPIEDLANYARNELAEIIHNAVKYDDLWSIIEVEELEGTNA